ncbi:MAG: LptA/OstA family protein, partial [Rhodospirillales bacterium]
MSPARPITSRRAGLAETLAFVLALAAMAAMAAHTGGGFGGAWAQSLNFGAKDSDLPIEIFADHGIEWQQENLVFLARGNARAVRGEVTVFADELRAYYREEPDGSTDIWRLDAEGKVRIKTADETAFGRKAIYQVDNGILVL